MRYFPGRPASTALAVLTRFRPARLFVEPETLQHQGRSPCLLLQKCAQGCNHRDETICIHLKPNCLQAVRLAFVVTEGIGLHGHFCVRNIQQNCFHKYAVR